MLRDPASDTGTEDHVLVVVGRDEQDLSVEWKSTDDSTSVYDGPAWDSGDAQLRLCRVGDRFTMARRPVGGGAWEQVQVLDRPDLPTTLQAGVIVYSAGDPDLLVLVEQVVFGTPAELGCA